MNAETFVANVKNLPPSPQILPKLLKLTQADNCSTWDIVELAKLDAALTVQVLKLSNSPYYGFATKSTDLHEAVSRIGFQELYKLVAILINKQLAGKEVKAYAMEPGELWEHSIACALCMEYFAKELDQTVSTCYTIGLFHALGKIVINEEEERKYEEIFNLIDAEKISLNDAEVRVLGFDHAEVGMVLLKKWDFSPEVYEPIGYQYKPLEAPQYSFLSCMIHLSLWVAASMGQNPGRNAWALNLEPAVIGKLGLKEESLHNCMLTVHERLQKIKRGLCDSI